MILSSIAELKRYRNKHNLYLLAFALSTLPLALILIYGLIFDAYPCKLCMYQRYVYASISAWSIIIFKTKKHDNSLSFVVLFALILLQLSISLFHFGVENQWFEYTGGCSSNLSKNIFNIQDLEAVLLSNDLIFCDIPEIIFGVSMSAWNLLYSIMVLGVLSILYYTITRNVKTP